MSQPPYDQQQLAAWYQQLAAMGYGAYGNTTFAYPTYPQFLPQTTPQVSAPAVPGAAPFNFGAALPVTLPPAPTQFKPQEHKQKLASATLQTPAAPSPPKHTTPQVAYATVAAKAATPKPSVPEHSPALKEYVKTVFLLGSQRNLPTDVIRSKLADFIKSQPDSFDWTTLKPNRFVDTIQTELRLQKGRPASAASSHAATGSGSTGNASDFAHKRASSFGPALPQPSSAESSPKVYTPPWKSKLAEQASKYKSTPQSTPNSSNSSGSGNSYHYKKTKDYHFDGRRSPYSSGAGDSSDFVDDDNEDEEEGAKAAARRARFQADRKAHHAKLEQNRKSQLSHVAYAEYHRQQLGDDEWDATAVVGTNTEHEKSFLRLIGKPNPALVRPLPVLERAFRETILPRYKREHNYTYMCDQMKSMRQDLLVQRLQTDFTVLVYETHAQIALEHADLGEYNACQTQLKLLYAKGMKGHQTEFLAYRILYLTYTKARGELKKLRYELRDFERRDPLVQFALSVLSAITTSNYPRFFELYQQSQSTALTRHLVAFMLHKERVRALGVIFASHVKVTMDYLTITLAFKTQLACAQFLNAIIAEVVVQDTQSFLINEDSIPNDVNCRALRSVPEAWLLMPKNKKVDIKGQVH
ncbi:hypothetical protein RI367_003900 [Sorochytrium milnesiophthora]